MAQEKTRIKFRVSAADGVSVSGLPAPRWSEKWGVSLFDYEEFHVTDQLLKLPFQENPPKTVCVFSLAAGALRFKLLDADRLAAVNGVEKREAIVGVGDRIRIGDHLTIEVVHAPSATGPGPAVSPTDRTPKPVPASEMKTTLAISPSSSSSGPDAEGPTLTLTTSGPVQPAQVFADQKDDSIEIDEPSFKRPSTERASHPAPSTERAHRPAETRPSGEAPALGRRALDADGSAPRVLAEPTLETVRPASAKAFPEAKSPTPSARPAMRAFLAPEPKVELANLPHAVRDDSLDSRAAEFARTGDPEEVYPRDARLDARPTLSERILSVFRVLRRDDLSPPDALPSDAAGKGSAQPWIPAEQRDPGISAMRDAHYGAGAGTPKPWIPQADAPGARMRGRALVFLVAATGALMIAAGVFQIRQNLERARNAENAASISFREMNRGIPIEILQDKVRRMRRR